MKSTFQYTLFVALSLALASAHAQTQSTTPQGSARTPQPSVSLHNAPANAITQTAVQQGVLNCAARINQVTTFLGYTPQAGALLMTPPAQPDQRLLPLAMELPAEVGTAYVVASFAPNQANGCGATYDAVSYWPQKCDAVAAKQFPGFKSLGQLKKSITVLDGGAASKIFLMPAGSGCVSIKKEIVL